MAAVFHILKRDVRGSWKLLCVMAALLALQVFQTWNIQIREYFYARNVTFTTAYSLLLYLVVMTIVVRVIQEDGLVGTSAFWLTRPISRKSLLGAKALYSLLFLVCVPVLANFILLFHHGMKGSQILPFLFDNMRVHLAILFIFAAFAAVTPNWVSFAIAEVMALIFLFMANNWFELPDMPIGGLSGLSIFGLLLLAVTLVTIIHQFLTRKTRRSIVFLIAGIVLAWAGCRYFIPYAPSNHQVRKAASYINLITSVKPANAGFYRIIYDGSGNKSIITSMEFQNVPASEEAVLTSNDGHLEFANGERISYNGGAIFPFGISHALRSLLPGLAWIRGSDISPQIQLLSVSPRVYKSLSAQPGTYSGNVKFDLFQNEILAESPLAAGRRIDMGPQPIVITGMDHQPAPGNLHVDLEQRGLMPPDNYKDSIFYCLVNRVRQQALAPLFSGVSNISMNRPMILFGADWRYRKWDLGFYGINYKISSEFKMDEAWLQDARLVVIHRRFLGTFDRKFTIRNFRMQDYTVERQQELSAPQLLGGQ